MQFSANAKINLGLFIKSKRPDGYHEIESVFLPLDWSDEIEFEQNDRLHFSSSGINIPDDTKGNLILRAYDILDKEFDLPPLKIHLQKNIPIGAGLGGGSSDASHMLKAMNSHFNLGISKSDLLLLSAKLGSDCPFFIENRPALVRGRGEVLEYDIDFSLNKQILVVVPPIHISTAEAYSLITPKKDRADLKKLIQEPISNWKGQIVNDFEEVLCRAYPELDSLRQKLLDTGADFVSMSGSGSAFFAFFDEKVQPIDLPSDYLIYSS